jgi:hypothetical protein
LWDADHPGNLLEIQASLGQPGRICYIAITLIAI